MVLRLPRKEQMKPNDSRLGVDINVCSICGKYKQPRFWVCFSCAKTYNLIRKPYKKWPQWVKELIRLRRKSEYRSRVLEEISFDPYAITVMIEDKEFVRGDGGFFTIA